MMPWELQLNLSRCQLASAVSSPTPASLGSGSATGWLFGAEPLTSTMPFSPLLRWQGLLSPDWKLRHVVPLEKEELHNSLLSEGKEFRDGEYWLWSMFSSLGTDSPTWQGRMSHLSVETMNGPSVFSI